MKTDYCAWPPEIATDVEIAEKRDGDRPAFIIGSASVGRYLLLRTAEHQALRLIGQERTPSAVCIEFKRRYGGTLQLATLTKFLTRLDEIGIRCGSRSAPTLTMSFAAGSRRLATKVKLIRTARRSTAWSW